MRKTANRFTTETVESIAAGVACDPKAPGGEWYVRQGSIWQRSHPVVIAHPAWFVELGRARRRRPTCPAGPHEARGRSGRSATPLGTRRARAEEGTFKRPL
jgi:hypothetical protein